MSILTNLQRIRNDLSSDTKFVVITKNRSIREINQAIFLGVSDIGENKVQEAKDKKPLIKEVVKWHFVGHLQRNKVKDAVEIFDMIQSVDSLRLAKKIDHVCKSKGKVMAVLVQINIGKEPQKHGLEYDAVEPFLRSVQNLKNIRVLGLMALAPKIDAKKTRNYFRKMRRLFLDLKKKNISNVEMKYLSMGMSNDYKIAVQEGSNMVRIGTKVFSEDFNDRILDDFI